MFVRRARNRRGGRVDGPSLRGRRLKGKGKGVLGASEKLEARQEGGKRLPGDHCFCHPAY